MANKMRVRVTGNIRPSLKEKIVEATRFYASRLMSSRLCSSMSICIRYERSEEYDGSCDIADDDERRFPRKFKILLRPTRDKEELFLTLAHEMVHVKQFARGELRYVTSAEKMKWKGEKIDDNEADYYEHPWEIEAYGREKGLFYRYVKEKDHHEWFKC